MAEHKRLQVYSIRTERDGQGNNKTMWVKAGSAWVNRDGSINVYLDVLPLDGKLHIREPVDEKVATFSGAPVEVKCSARLAMPIGDSPSGRGIRYETCELTGPHEVHQWGKYQW